MPADRPSVLFIDMSHTLETVRARGQDSFFEARHSGGYFGRVWGVHPLADRGGKQSRQIETLRFSDRQEIIEGVAQTLALPKPLMPLNFLISQRRLIRQLAGLIRREDISMIATTDPGYAGLLGRTLKRRTGRPLVVRIYSNNDELYEASRALMMPKLIPFRWLENLIVNKVLTSADVVIAPNQNYLDYALRHGARGMTGIVSNAQFVLDLHRSDPATRGSPEAFFAERGIPFGRPTLLHVGRLIALKHAEDALRAMAMAITHRPDAIGLFAGTGDLRPRMKALTEELGVGGKVFFLGAVKQEDLARIIPHCITLSPLTGMALIECALGASAPVVYHRDWQPEFVEEGVSGLVVPFRDHQAMGERALQLIEDPELARQFGQRIRARALDLSDREKIHASEAALFDRLLKRNQRASA